MDQETGRRLILPKILGRVGIFVRVAPLSDPLWWDDIDAFRHSSLVAVRLTVHNETGLRMIAFIFLMLNITIVLPRFMKTAPRSKPAPPPITYLTKDETEHLENILQVARRELLALSEVRAHAKAGAVREWTTDQYDGMMSVLDKLSASFKDGDNV